MSPSDVRSLSKVQREFERWRNNPSRSKHERVPERLWEMAGILAQEVPPTLVASRLKISRDRLFAEVRRRKPIASRGSRPARTRPPKAGESAFVQVTLPAPQVTVGRIEIEWVDACGRSVRLRSTADAFRRLLFATDADSSGVG